MWKQKLGFSIGQSFGMTIPEAVQLVKNSGFDALSPEWTPDGNHLAYIAVECPLQQALGLLYGDFFPADGGVWKLEATRNVAAYFEEALKDLIEAGIVVVIR